MNYKIAPHPLLSDQLCLYATVDISPGTLLFSLKHLPIMPTNNRFAITKIPEKEYYDTVGQDVRLINHSCDPNIFINVNTGEVISKKQINKGEMFTFDYLTTEPTMTDPFYCICGSEMCKKYINGSINQ